MPETCNKAPKSSEDYDLPEVRTVERAQGLWNIHHLIYRSYWG